MILVPMQPCDYKTDGDRGFVSLRDHFAMAALTGLLSSMQKNVYAEEMASHAYELADAMLAEREKI